jgi:hypothetical protein
MHMHVSNFEVKVISSQLQRIWGNATKGPAASGYHLVVVTNRSCNLLAACKYGGSAEVGSRPPLMAFYYFQLCLHVTGCQVQRIRFCYRVTSERHRKLSGKH